MARIASPIVAAGDAFELGADAEPFRAEARAFLSAHAPGGHFPPDFGRHLATAGLVAPHWPRPWGLDAGPLQQLAVDAELRGAKAPRPFNPIGIGWAGPTLLVAGTQAQQERWLPGILDGSEIWCQLFSEPGAGSDLASLSTRATRDGDEWVVTGQKVWTTFAHLARWGILLARTDPGAEAHRGISYFVVDMRAPGITVQPIRQMDGNADFNEVFLEDVRIPAGALVGTEHDGWRLAKVTLGNERVSLSGEGALWGQGPTADDVLDLVRAQGGTVDPILRQRLALLHIESQVLRLIRLRTLSARGPRPRTRARGIGAQGARRRARAARHGARARPRGHRRASSPTTARSAPRPACGPTATCTPAR